MFTGYKGVFFFYFSFFLLCSLFTKVLLTPRCTGVPQVMLGAISWQATLTEHLCLETHKNTFIFLHLCQNTPSTDTFALTPSFHTFVNTPFSFEHIRTPFKIFSHLCHNTHCSDTFGNTPFLFFFTFVMTPLLEHTKREHLCLHYDFICTLFTYSSALTYCTFSLH